MSRLWLLVPLFAVACGAQPCRRVIELEEVYSPFAFDEGSSEWLPAENGTLATEIAQHVTADPTILFLEVQGDAVEGEGDVATLAAERARVALDHLVEAGLDPARVRLGDEPPRGRHPWVSFTPVRAPADCR